MTEERRNHIIDPRQIYVDTVKYVSHPVDVDKEIIEKYPAQLGKDASLTILDDHEIYTLIQGIEEKALLDFADSAPIEMLDYRGAEVYRDILQITDYAFVRLRKSKEGMALKHALSSIQEVKYSSDMHEGGGGFLSRFRRGNKW